MPIYINDSGILRESKPFVNVGGVIKEVQEGWQNEEGVLKQVYNRIPKEVELIGSEKALGGFLVKYGSAWSSSSPTITSNTKFNINVSYNTGGSTAGGCYLSVHRDLSDIPNIEIYKKLVVLGSCTYEATGSYSQTDTIIYMRAENSTIASYYYFEKNRVAYTGELTTYTTYNIPDGTLATRKTLKFGVSGNSVSNSVSSYKAKIQITKIMLTA